MTILAPPPKFGVTFVNANGETRPGIGYKLYTYLAGSSTPKDTYHDITLGSPNQNPVVMDSRGECDLWLNGSYKFILKTDLDSTVWEVDEIRDPFVSQTFTNTTLAGTLTISSTAVTWSGNPTHSGNHTFTGNVTVNGNTTIGNGPSDTLNIAPSSITWNSSVTHNGAHVFTDTVTAAALNITSGAIIPGTYAPTATSVFNLDSVTPTGNAIYARLGSSIIVCGAISCDTTAATATLTAFRLSLPVASNLAAVQDLNGVATAASNGGITNGGGITITADATNNDALFTWLSNNTTGLAMTYIFMYRVI